MKDTIKPWENVGAFGLGFTGFFTVSLVSKLQKPGGWVSFSRTEAGIWGVSLMITAFFLRTQRLPRDLVRITVLLVVGVIAGGLVETFIALAGI
jgi:hypothetical protein